MNNFFPTYKVMGFAVWMLVFLVPQVTTASVIRSGESVSLAEDQMVAGDFYSVANKVNVSGEIGEDMLSVGGEITVNGSVGHDALLIGGQVDVHGFIGDDLRVVAAETVVAEPVNGDLLVIGSDVTILSTASVSGDVILMASHATIEGAVAGDILGAVEILRIDAPIAGDVDVRVKQLTLGDNAAVDGSVRYVSYLALTKSLNATVFGDEVRSDPLVAEDDGIQYPQVLLGLLFLFSVLVWYLVARPLLSAVTTQAVARPTRSFIVGFAAFFVTPAAIGVLAVSFLGVFVALVLFFLYAVLGLLSVIASAAVLGTWLYTAFFPNKVPVAGVTLSVLVLGVVAMMLLSLLQVVGPLLLVGIVLLTLGAITDVLIRPVITTQK